MQLTVKQVALRLGISPASIYIAIKDGRLRAERVFDRIVINDADADTYGSRIGIKNGYAKRARAEA